MYVRRNVYDLGGDWADPILWYARGVKALQARPISDPTSWRFYGAIHGIDPGLWRTYGYLADGEKLPSQAQQDLFWNQCQHQTWYFLPWHRGYVLAIEDLVRQVIIDAGGPSDWAMPYWNYFGPNQNTLPPAFATPDWPDGKGDNPLFIPQRWGPNNDGNVYVPMDRVNMKALNLGRFTSIAQPGVIGQDDFILVLGFGGVKTGFSHDGQFQGGVESQPHNMVHVVVGGQNPANSNLPGLMADPDTAGLDPIFWLHHANIDRLWSIWNASSPSHTNPTDPQWQQGPASVGDRAFAMPRTGGVTWYYTPKEMISTQALGYQYDSLSPTGVSPAPAAPPHVMTFATTGLEGATAMANPKAVQMLGASDTRIPVVGNRAQTAVSLRAAPRAAIASAFAVTDAKEEPESVFLMLENIRGIADATALQVYIDLPENAIPSENPDRLAESIGLFGLRKASNPDSKHAGAGLTFVLDITEIVKTLHLQNKLDEGALQVAVVPSQPVAKEAELSIGRISLYRRPG